MSCSSKANLKGSGLPLATVTGRGWGATRWLTGFCKGVPECDSFSGLPHAALGRGDRYGYIVYLGGGCQIGYVECYNP